MITVLQPGLMSTIQDEGRQDFLAYGLPMAGVMDRYAARMANLLCGNPLGAAVIEMTMLGGSFRIGRACRIALCGADMSPLLNGVSIENWSAVDVFPGDLLETGFAKKGCRSYLAVSGGITVPVIMGSRSTYTRAGIGGINGKALKADEQIPTGENLAIIGKPSRIEMSLIPEYPDHIKIRVLLGPQEELFTQEGISTFLKGEYKVSDEADRMGYRLEGPQINHVDKADIISDAVGRGAVQVPGNGQPIVMMADCGTTGGYAKIATVIGSDLWRLAQAKPQDSICFEQCTETEAIQALSQERAAYLTAGKSLSGTQATEINNARKMKLVISNKTYHVEIKEV